jgi:hypothetical protein
MPILKQDRNSTHHGGIGFPRIIVLAASLDQNNGTIATKKCKRLLSPRHGTVQTLRHVVFHVFSYGHLHVLQALPLRSPTYVQLDGETAISSPNGLVVHGQGCQNFDLNTCQRNKRAPGVPVQNANQISGFTVPRLVGTSQEKATLSPSDTAIGLDVLPTIHFRLENMRGASSISCHLWQFKIATKHESYIDVNQMILAYICHYQA